MNEFCINDKVRWTSQSGGYKKTKYGMIVAIVHPNQPITEILDKVRERRKGRVAQTTATYQTKLKRWVVEVVMEQRQNEEPFHHIIYPVYYIPNEKMKLQAWTPRWVPDYWK